MIGVEDPVNGPVSLPYTRSDLEGYIASLIDLLDTLEPDPDLEDGDPAESYIAGSWTDAEGDPCDNGEHSLGWCIPMPGLGQYVTNQDDEGDHNRQSCWMADAEAEHDGCEPDVDAEGSLGWTLDGGGKFCGGLDLEQDKADDEPWLAAPEGAQGYGGNGRDCSDREAS